jgi:hypothetical protein
MGCFSLVPEVAMFSRLLNHACSAPRGLTFPGLAVGAWLILAGPAPANQIDEVLRNDAKDKLWQAIKQGNYKNVGVLRFQVQIDDEKPGFHFGDLNALMATRVGNLLILTNTEKPPLGVILNASAQAAKLDPAASWSTAAARAKLFGHTFTRPWHEAGSPQQVKADAFITGVVKTTKKYDQTTIELLMFDARDEKPRKIHEFSLPTERSTLVDMNVGFKTEIRDLKQRSKDLIKIVDAPNIGDGSQGNSGKAYTELLDLKVFYDDKEVALDGNKLPTPEVGQKIHFNLASKKDKKVAVLLMINGVNTLYEERGRELDKYARWVLEPKKTYGIYGFHPDEKTMKPFVAVPLEKVAPSDFVPAEYFKIYIVVFEDIPLASDIPPATIQLRTDPGKSVGSDKASLDDLKKAIRKNNEGESRNLIGTKGPEDVAIETTTFQGPPTAYGLLVYGPAKDK